MAPFNPTSESNRESRGGSGIMELAPLSRGKYEDDSVDDAPGDGTETEHAVDESTPSPDESVESNVEWCGLGK